MVLSDYLSRQTEDKSGPHQIIPISFNIREVSLKPCQSKTQDMFPIQTRSQAKGVKPPMKRENNRLHKQEGTRHKTHNYRRR